MTVAAQLHIRLLGRFQVEIGQQPVPPSTWRLRTAAALVKLLALAPAYRLHREQLMDTLWPDAEPAAAANNLRYSLHAARRIFAGPDDATPYLQREGELLILGPLGTVWTDVAAFEEGVAAAWQWPDPHFHQDVLALYVGDLLPEERYEDWVANRRTALRTSYLALLGRLAELHEQRGDLDQAIQTLQQLLIAEPIQEAAHAGLMRLYARSGQPAQALDQFHQLTELLARELEVEPEPATRALYDAIGVGRYPDVAAPSEPLIPEAPAEPLTWARVPLPLSELIGRERELAELGQLLATSRLVTLTGPGGIGKTSLGLALANAIQDRRPSGALVVDLSVLRDPVLVISTIARAVGVREAGGDELFQRLTRQLAGRRLMLMLDNFEQVLAAAPTVANLLAACPELRVLVTSRRRLGLRGEQEYPVGPLALPDAKHAPSADRLLDYPAVALFLARVHAIRPAFQVTDTVAPAIAAICQRLDGIPLALELAATRSKVLAPPELLAQLEHRLDLLTGGSRDAPPRQQTLRDTIGWSYDLLTPAEQRLFRWLGVFAGGFTLEAAEVVCGPEHDVLDGLTALVDHSLARAVEQPDLHASTLTTRFSMLETIREYGLEQLDVHAEAAEARARHAGYFLTLAKQAGPSLDGPDASLGLDRLEMEHDNLRAALAWAIDERRADLALRLASAVWRLWEVRGYLNEGRHWLEAVLRTSDQLTMPIRTEAVGSAEVGYMQARAECRVGLGRLLSFTQSPADALPWLHQAIDDFAQIGCQSGLCRALEDLGFTYVLLADWPAAVRYCTQLLRLATELGDGVAVSLANEQLGLIAWRQGDLSQALDYLQRALEVAERIGNHRAVVHAASDIAGVYGELGNLTQALAHLQQALAGANQIGYQQAIGVIIGNAGALYEQVGDYSMALACYKQALRVAAELDDWPGIFVSIGNAATVLAAQGHADEAERLFKQAIALGQALQDPFVNCRYLTDLAQFYAQHGRHADAAALTQEGWALARQVGRDEVEFEAQILSILLRVRLGQSTALTALGEFETMMAAASDDLKRARLHYEVWRLDPSREDARSSAAALLRPRAERSATIDDRQRYMELTKEALPTPDPLPALAVAVDRDDISVEALLAQLRLASRLPTAHPDHAGASLVLAHT